MTAMLTGDDLHHGALLQGAALLGSFTMFGFWGWAVGGNSPDSILRLLHLLIAAGVAAGILNELGLTPFVALTVPAAFAALILAALSPKRRLLYLVTFLGLLVVIIRTLFPQEGHTPVSIAVIAQVVVCAFLVLLRLAPRTFRPVMTLSAVAIAAWLAVRHDIPALLIGRLMSEDVTIAQRSYEAAAVWDSTSSNPATLLFGRGPGATVDLSGSPDIATLLSSGRNLVMVDDVHLLTSYVLLKMGILGVIWLVAFAFAVCRAARAAYRDTIHAPALLGLLLFAVAGSVTAVPAATHFFTNPLVPLLVGVLAAQEAYPFIGVCAGTPDSEQRHSPIAPFRNDMPGRPSRALR